MERKPKLLHVVVLLLWSTLSTCALGNPSSIAREEEEVLILVSVSHIGHFEINALIAEQQIKLPVVKLLSLIGIDCQWTNTGSALRILWPGLDKPLEIAPSGQIIGHKGPFTSSPGDLRFISGDLFIPIPLWDSIFPTKTTFSFQDMAVEMQHLFGSPLLQKPTQEQIAGIQRRAPDLIIGNTPYLLRGGALDYQLQYLNQGPTSIAEGLIKMGGGLLGGNTQAGLFFSSAEKFNWQRQQFSWALQNRNIPVLRNLQLGNIAGPAIVRTFSPHFGLMLNNTPDTPRVGQWTYQFQAGSAIARGAWFMRPEISWLSKTTFSTGFGLEYYSTLDTKIWFLSARYNPVPGLSLRFEHAARARTLLCLVAQPLPGISATYTFEHQSPGSEMIYFPFQERQRLELTARFRILGAWGGTTLDTEWQRGTQFAMGTLQHHIFLFWKHTRLHLLTRLNFPSPTREGLFSSIGIDQRLGRNSSLRAESRFLGTGLRGYGLEIAYYHRISHLAEISAAYQEGFQRGNGTLQLQFSYNLGALRAFTSIVAKGRQQDLAQGISGSLFFQDGRSGLEASAESGIGKGGLLVYPFVDINHNTRRDPGEPAAAGAMASLEGQQAKATDKDTIIRFDQLPAGKAYTLYFDPKDLEDVFWSFRYSVILARVEPAQYQRIEVPVQPKHEIHGFVPKGWADDRAGNRKVFLFDLSGHLLHNTWPDHDGSYAFSDLAPGAYIVSPENNIEAPGACKVQIAPTRHGQQIGPVHLGTTQSDFK